MSAARMSQVIVPTAFTTLPADADKRTIITLLANSLVKEGKVKPESVGTIIEEAMRREAVGSTGIGHGIAIPHCRTLVATDMMCAYGQCHAGLDFDSLDGEPVHSVFLLLTPPERKEDHLALMKSFASQIRKEHFCEFLHQVGNGKALVELLNEFEAR